MKLVKVTLITLIVLANNFDKIQKQPQYLSISEKLPQRKLREGEDENAEPGTGTGTGDGTGGGTGTGTEPKENDGTTCGNTGSYIIVNYYQDVELSFSGGETSKIKTICSNKRL